MTKWRKSSHSGAKGGECVELARMPLCVAVRDSKQPTDPALSFAPPQWDTFIRNIKAGQYDLT